MGVLLGIGKPTESLIPKSKTMESSEVEPIPQVRSRMALESSCLRRYDVVKHVGRKRKIWISAKKDRGLC